LLIEEGLPRLRVRFVSQSRWDGSSDKAMAPLFGRNFRGFTATRNCPDKWERQRPCLARAACITARLRTCSTSAMPSIPCAIMYSIGVRRENGERWIFRCSQV
jgi:hypothetical protein